MTTPMNIAPGYNSSMLNGEMVKELCVFFITIERDALQHDRTFAIKNGPCDQTGPGCL